MKKVVIIGSGPTGLITGLSLSEKEANFDINIFDASEHIGGLTGSEEIDGMPFDYGPHIFHSNDEEIIKFIKKHCSDLLVEKEFFYKNYKEGELYDYPISWDSIEKFSTKIKQKIKDEVTNLNSENLKRARNFKECVVELVGPTLQSIFFEKYTEKLWGIPSEKTSADWAPNRIELRKKNKAFYTGQFSACGKYGAGPVMERFADLAKINGVKFHLGHLVTELKTDDNCITKICFANGKVIDVSNSIVVSTIPLVYLCDMLDIPCDLMFNSIRFVYLIMDKSKALPEGVHSIYFAHDNVHFYCVSEQKQYSDSGYPDDKTLLIFEVSCTVRKDLDKMSEEQIVDEVLDQFCGLGFVEKRDFIKGFTRKMPYAHPIMQLGYEKKLASVNYAVGKYENLHLAGGSAEFIYGDVQTMIARGWEIADLLSSKHYQINKNIKRGKRFKFNNEVNLCGFTVGEKHPAIIIAEIGINHRGSVEVAKELIQQAKNCGCEIAKLQTYTGANRVSDSVKEAKYADRTLGMEESTSEMFSRFELSYNDHVELMEYSKEVGISLISTPFDEKSVDILLDLGVKAFKIASFDIVNLPFLRYVASKGLPIILSSGMSHIGDIEEALKAISLEKNPNIILLHCVSAYPADISDINLNAIITMKKTFGVPVGYSDHTIGPLASNVAFSLDADLLEKHFTLDTFMEGPDHILSSDVAEMKEIVANRNKIFISLGDGIKRPASVEYKQINLQRKSIFSKRLISKNEKITLDNISIKGPGHGLLPRYLPIILGKTVTSDILADTPITWDDILTG